MKKTLSIAFLAANCFVGQAQEEVKQEKEKRFSIGMQAVLMNSPYSGYNIQEYGGGMYMRYFMGKRLALSMQANSTIGTRYGVGIGDIKRRSFDVPVLMEYHLSPGSKVRPYFAFGGGITSQHTSIKFHDGNPNYYSYTQSPFLQIAYGTTFKVGKKLNINTSLFYRYNISTRESSVGLTFGIGRR